MKEETVSEPQKEIKVTSSVLEAFDLLKDAKDETKLIGGSKIISQLVVNENEKDLKYVLKRLVRSLGANIPDMRTGYFATLVTLLSKFEQVSVAQLLELAKKELHSNGSSKSEVGDVALGQILVCSALFRSGRILKCTTEEQSEVIQLLLASSKKKSYLNTVAYLILLDFVNGVDADQFGQVIWPLIKPEFKRDIKEHSLDSLYFLFVISTKFPDKVKLRKLIGSPEILCEDNIHTVCEKIMTGIDFNSVGHPIYKEIAIKIANSSHLQLFWTSGIDSQLVKHNRNRELVAVNILTTILTNIHENYEVIPELISRNFFKLFMDWFKGLQTASKIRSKRDNEDDNKLMIKKQKELLNALCKALKSEKVDNTVRVEVLKKLLFTPGEINFTEITGTTIVKSIIADLNKDGVKKMAKLFKGVLLNTSKKSIKEDVERNWYNNERVKAAELLSYLVSHESVKDDTEFKLTYMKLLMCFGFFKVGGDETVPISIELSSSIKSCFYRCFTSRFSNVDNLVTVLSSLCSFICSILQKEQIRAKIEKQFPQENVDCWEMLMEVCQNIEKNDIKSKVDNVFLILLYQLGLFLFSEPVHVKIAKSSIKELKSCYEHYRKGKKKKPKLVTEGDLTSEPEWIEVLVEVLLSILSAESSVLRSVVQCVFRLLWEYLTPSSIGQIISVLDPENESNPLTHDDSGSENEDDSDIEEKENGNNSTDSDKEEEEEDDSDSQMEDDDEEDLKTPDQLRLAIQKALGSAAPESETESIDADTIDEKEGKKLDEALAEAFKQFRQGKGRKTKKDRKDKKTLSDFRVRVLDLIDIYLEKDPSMDICLGMIAPLTRCLEFCIQDQFTELENRVRKTIKNLAKVRKFSSVDDVSIEILCDYMKATIDKGARSHFLFQALGDVITFFATFIIHCSLKIKYPKSPKKTKSAPDVNGPLLSILKESLQSYFQNRNCMLPIIFFHNILQTEWNGSYELVPVIIENVFNNGVRQFRRNEGLELMAGFFRALRRNKPNSEKVFNDLLSLEAKFENALIQISKSNTEFTVKNNFLTTLKKLINIIKLFHESCKIQTNLDFKAMLEIVGSCKCLVSTNNKQVTEKQNKKAKKNNRKRKIEQVNGKAEHQQQVPRVKIKKTSEIA
ncbi:unnamed protein product [Arctia plantaginis]|uniref:DNA polymerase V n=1 Tax=Arctia plantaginis TaxID=874455 RepID=A0A8S1AI42_ARCPL|nr:unnamed protein product [Arctia plantaginis]